MNRRTSCPLALVLLVVATSSPAQTPCGFPPGGEPGWCDRTQAGADGILGTGDDRPDCIALAGTAGSAPCTQHQSTRWVIQDGPACNDCRYELFVSVSCGSDLWLIFDDAEGMKVSAQVVGIPDDLPLFAENECRVREGTTDPFIYCDGCIDDQHIVPKEDPDDEPPFLKGSGSCLANGPFGMSPWPEITCRPWMLSGPAVWWGRFALDTDGDGVPDTPGDLPCAACGPPDCICGDTSSNHRVSDGQYVRVHVEMGVPGPQVVRIQIESADADRWSLIANCDGSVSTQQYSIYDTCEAATAALSPGTGLPNLSLPDPATAPGIVATDLARCPEEMTVEVTICNSGDAVATSAPITLITVDGISPYRTGDQTLCPDGPGSGIGPILPGECRTCPWVVSHDPILPFPDRLEVWVDMSDVVAECADHLRGRDGCGVGPDYAAIPWCDGTTPRCRAVAACSATPRSICLGANVDLSAAGSSVAGCAGVLEVQYEDAAGNALPGGAFPAPMTLAWTPASPGPQPAFVRARCSTDPSCTALSRAAVVMVAEPGPFPTPIVAAPEGSCAIRLTWTAAGVGTYDVYRDTSSPVALDAAHRIASGLLNPSYLDAVTTLDPYFYRVELVDGCGRLPNGGGEASASATAPSFPSSLSAVVEGECGIRLSWTAGAAGSTYDLYRDTTSPVALDAAHRLASGLTGTTYLDAVTAPGPFHYRVELVASCARTPNAGGEATASPRLPSFPSAVAVATEGECALRVTWTTATVAAGTLTYDVYRGDALPVPLDAGHRIATGLTTTSFLDTPPWGPAYAYRVEAVTGCARVPNGGGDSAPVAMIDLQDPTFAGIVNTLDLGGCQVEVSWNDASAADSCSGIAGFNVYRDHGVGHRGETLVASLVPASPYIDTTPGNGTWVYVVRAVDRSGREEQNDVFQQESEGSCTNDFPSDAGLDNEDGMDSPNADGGHFAPVVVRRHLHEGLRIRWKPSSDEGGLYPVTYSVLRGDLSTLRTTGYSHVLVDDAACGLTVHEYLMMGQDDGAAAYYLVAPVSGDNVTFGYDSTGRRLPPAEVCE